MEIKEVTEGFSVVPQPSPAEIGQLANLGYTAIICNRPDGEEDGQPSVEEMRNAAEQAGLAFHHIPLSGGVFPEAAVAAFRAVRRGTVGKVLAYCRTGTRSITLETLANPGGQAVADRLQAAQAAGYDLSALAERLRAE